MSADYAYEWSPYDPREPSEAMDARMEVAYDTALAWFTRQFPNHDVVGMALVAERHPNHWPVDLIRLRIIDPDRYRKAGAA